MRKSKFTIDGIGKTFEGYTKGGTWNGWAMPYFTKEQADKIMEALLAQGEPKAKYHVIRDQYRVILDGMDEGDVEIYEGFEIDGTKYYDIGAGCWCWDEVHVCDELRDFREHMYESIVQLREEIVDDKPYDNRFDLRIELNGKQVAIEMDADVYSHLATFIDELMIIKAEEETK